MSTSAGFLTEPIPVTNCIEQRMHSYGLSAYGVTKLICYLRGETNYRSLQKAVTDALHAIERSKLPMVFDIVTALGGELGVAWSDKPALLSEIARTTQTDCAGLGGWNESFSNRLCHRHPSWHRIGLSGHPQLDFQVAPVSG
jgi:hypothetical protein